MQVLPASGSALGGAEAGNGDLGDRSVAEICGVSLRTAGALAGILGPGERFASEAQPAAQAGVIASQRAADWLASLVAADEAGRFFCAVGGFLVSGRKPR